jgi:hypothetical protein
VSDTNTDNLKNIGNSCQVERFKNPCHEFMNYLSERYLPGFTKLLFTLEEEIALVLSPE